MSAVEADLAIEIVIRPHRREALRFLPIAEARFLSRGPGESVWITKSIVAAEPTSAEIEEVEIEMKDVRGRKTGRMRFWKKMPFFEAFAVMTSFAATGKWNYLR